MACPAQTSTESTLAGRDDSDVQLFEWNSVNRSLMEERFMAMVTAELAAFRLGNLQRFVVDFTIRFHPSPVRLENLMGPRLVTIHYKGKTSLASIRVQDFDNLERARVLARKGTAWVDLESFLKSHPAYNPSAANIATVDDQFRWWLATGKPFRFQDLPGELRRNIYRYSVGPEVNPYAYTHRNYKESSQFRWHNSSTAPNTQLFRVSKQVEQEFSCFIFNSLGICFQQSDDLRRFLGHQHNHVKLRTIKPSFPLEHLRSMFWVGMLRTNPRGLTDAVKVLRELETLETIVLSIPRRWQKVSCQKLAVQYVLELAWPYIGDRHIVLEGCVKQSHKTWVTQNRLIAKMVLDEQWEASRSQSRSKPWDSFPCRCSRHCARESWSEED